MKVTALLSLALVSQVKSEFDLTKTVKIATNEAQLVKTCFLQMSRNSNKVDLPAEDQAKFELWGEFYSQFIDNLIVDSAPVAILQKLAKFVYLEDFNDSKPYFEACKNLRVDYSGNHLLNDFIPKTSELEARKGSLWAMVFSLHPISDYACWCHFGKKAGQGAGNAQNMVDQICQNLQLCYRCIKHDHGDPMHTSLLDALSNTNYAPDANGTAIITPVCDPWKTDYLVEMSHGVSDTTVSGIVNMCSINNPNTCKFSVCACEMKMLTEFWNKVTLSNYGVDYTMKHANGFDYDGICKTRVFNNGDKACCGKYPERRPYPVGLKHCCEGTTLYDNVMKICCEDGSVADVGVGCA